MSIYQTLQSFLAASKIQQPRNVRRFDQRRSGSLAGEVLEDRRVLAGNMTVAYDAGNKMLTVTGDAEGNEVNVRFDSPDALAPTIYGVNGTTINGSSSLNVGLFTGGGEVMSVSVNAGDGNDSVAIETFSTPVFLPNTTINGEAGNDTVLMGSPGGAAVDFDLLVINGGTGDDTMKFLSSLWSPGICQIDGGSDNDTYVFDTDQPLGTIQVSEAGGGFDILDFSLTGSESIAVDLLVPIMNINSNMQLNLAAGSRIERIAGGSLNDTLLGDGFDNELIGNDGDDRLEGRLGNNTLSGGNGNDRYEIGARTIAETDTLIDGSGLDYLLMSAFDSDIVINLSAASGPQTVSGNLVLNLNGSHFTGVSTGNGNDKITGRASLGTAMNGNFGNDQLSGGSGDDFLYGSPGIDSLAGWNGSDTYIFDTDGVAGTTSIFDQGTSIDTLDFSLTTTRSIAVDLGSTSPQVVNAGLTLKLSAGSVIENVIGGAMPDTIYGNELVNQLSGSGPNDLLIGNGNADRFAFDVTISDGMTARVRAGVPQQTVNLSGIGDSVGGSRPLHVTATSSNTSLIPTPSVSYVSPDEAGTLYFTPLPGKSGNATITVVVEDGGPDNNLATPGDNVTDASVFYVEVTATVPTFTAPPSSATQRPTFSWSSISGAVSYRLTVNNLSTGVPNVINTTVSTTSFTPSGDLGIGRYSAWVRAITAGGVSLPWSVAWNFRIETPVTVLPSAYLQSTPRPTIAWNALPGAHHYDVWVNNVTTGQLLYRNPTVMGNSWTSATDLPLGLYRFWVRGIDAAGNAALWSTTREFVVATPPVPVSPVNSTFELNPTFTWNPVLISPGASPTYSVYLTNLNTGASTSVNGILGTNWTPPSNLPVGLYRWWVQGVLSGSVRTAWSNPVDFNVGGRPVLLPPSGGTPVLNWRPVTGAASYNVWVDRIDVYQSGVIKVTGVTGTSYDRGTPLPSGRYRVWVQAVSATSVTSSWSVPLEFTVAAGSASFDWNDSINVAIQLTSDGSVSDPAAMVNAAVALNRTSLGSSRAAMFDADSERIAPSVSLQNPSEFSASGENDQGSLMDLLGAEQSTPKRFTSTEDPRSVIGLVDEVMTLLATRDFTMNDVG